MSRIEPSEGYAHIPGSQEADSDPRWINPGEHEQEENQDNENQGKEGSEGEGTAESDLGQKNEVPKVKSDISDEELLRQQMERARRNIKG